MKIQIKNRYNDEIIIEGDYKSTKDALEKNKGANLGGADLGGAYLGEADLGGADLRGADLGGAYLVGADLGGADLEGADLRGATLWGAVFGNNIYDAKWGVPSDGRTAFILLSLKVDLNTEIAQAMLLNASFCWSEAIVLAKKYPKILKQIKKEWPKLYDKLTENKV